MKYTRYISLNIIAFIGNLLIFFILYDISVLYFVKNLPYINTIDVFLCLLWLLLITAFIYCIEYNIRKYKPTLLPKFRLFVKYKNIYLFYFYVGFIFAIIALISFIIFLIGLYA